MSHSIFNDLIKVVQERNVTKVKRLMKLGRSVISPDGNYTLFHVAAQNGHADIIQAMSASKDYVNTPDKNGFTPIFMAAQHGHVDVIKALCALGADVNTPDEDGCTPVYAALRMVVWMQSRLCVL